MLRNLFSVNVKPLIGLVLLTPIIVNHSPAVAQEQSLKVVYPRTNHKTSSDKIFFIGTAPQTGQVFINDRSITRSQAGHFAPSFPLKLGDNKFTVRHGNQKIEIVVTRVATEPKIPRGLAFAVNSLTPAVDIARMPDDRICFSAIAPPDGKVSVRLGYRNIRLYPQPQQAKLPSNLAALTGTNQPYNKQMGGKYAGCTVVGRSGNFGQPVYKLDLKGKKFTQRAPGKVSILSPAILQVVEVTADAGVARTGPSTNYSRLTPLPKGTRAAITGSEGDWLRLDYGAWINGKETQILNGAIPPATVIRSVGSRKFSDATQITFPLQVPVPISVHQSDRTFSLTLHNTTAQTDIIRLDDNPFISRLDWQQITPSQVRYTFNVKSEQQWGHTLSYEGTSLVLKLRHAPRISRSRRKPLSGIKILLDPGHGGKESGAVGPTGYPEKDVNLSVSKLLRDALVKRGATVVMTREDDQDVSLRERQKIIAREEPALALSVHYNALPDYGDAENTRGVGIFWYHPQAHSSAIFLHNYLVKKLNRPSYGVFWNNLALTRPAEAPSLLLELGFMSNPSEFEWVVNPKSQQKLANTLADGIVEWFKTVR
ncbi:MAG: N-acetylmuramoyl-L-alanine amidase [Mastigocoleus sp. MO_167.B18]|uniref:N-acetylmuramoyl-L-alanine amidase n=1 Tax=Mastigocoleus sp. MO_188.B34 TaxID=3036635 RepID=UPI002615AD1D|nr:N-acetylmuramoyl-L-alanine amidase [Mastigocoleus sp. MO_188.B34]MDJ0694391.1 N-acetylmuramoyl-L-alanine amidase [Mastigocoleus sp. MO_188.B34]MDJ0772345.1 N-acetylmuramoyl-L-alanine amidase [Mastigocoleus sp. MO_167.B18]